MLEAMYRWQSQATDLTGRMSRQECEYLMRQEYALLARVPRPPGDLLPRVIGCGVGGQQSADWPSGCARCPHRRT